MKPTPTIDNTGMNPYMYEAQCFQSREAAQIDRKDPLKDVKINAISIFSPWCRFYDKKASIFAW